MPYQEHIVGSSAEHGRCAVITLSDTRTPETDKSGKRIQELLTDAGHAIVRYQLIPDDPARLDALLTELLASDDVDVIMTNGGTGISRRDQTVPVIEAVIDSPIPGFGELFRMLSHQEIGSGECRAGRWVGSPGGS